MKIRNMVSLIWMLLFVSGIVFAEEAIPKKDEVGYSGVRSRLLLKEYDKDKDSKLSEVELMQLCSERHANRKNNGRRNSKNECKEKIKKYDKDNDGKLSEAELSEACLARRSNRTKSRRKGRDMDSSRYLRIFDKDGDGKLSEKERANMEKEWGSHERKSGNHRR